MLPNLIVIGAMKAGTSSLHHYLALHPDVSMSRQKELNFFERSWERGIDWYEAQFPDATPVRGESSPNYTKYPRHGAEAPARMHSLVPEARIVYLVRDPIARIVSHYVDAYSFGRVSRPLAEELETAEGDHFVACSRYHMQLSRYLVHYDLAQVLVVTSEHLRERRGDALREVFRFLGVDESFWTPEYDLALNRAEDKRRSSRLAYAFEELVKRSRTSPVARLLPRGLAGPVRTLTRAGSRRIPVPAVDERLRERLVAELSNDVAALRRLTGKPLAEWSL